MSKLTEAAQGKWDTAKEKIGELATLAGTLETSLSQIEEPTENTCLSLGARGGDLERLIILSTEIIRFVSSARGYLRRDRTGSY